MQVNVETDVQHILKSIVFILQSESNMGEWTYQGSEHTNCLHGFYPTKGI